MRIVLDTNVLVSALLNSRGMPGRLVDRVLAAPSILTVLYDERMLAEYIEVLGRPKFNFNSLMVDRLLLALHTFGEHVIEPPALEFDPAMVPDVDDLPFAEVALSGRADVLVTGNPKHFSFLIGVPVLSPSQLWLRLEAEE